MNDSALIYLFIILLAVFGVLLSLLMLKYLSLVNRIKEQQKSEAKKDSSESEAVAAKLAQAETQAKQIIESAYQKAQAVASETASFRQKEHSLAQEVYDKAIKAEIEQLKKDIENSRAKTIEVLTNVSQTASNEVHGLVAQTGQVLEKQTTQIAADLQKELASSLQKTQSEFENYKKLRIEQFEADLVKMTALMATQILKKEIDQTQHKKFAAEALAKFKKDVLSNS